MCIPLLSANGNPGEQFIDNHDVLEYSIKSQDKKKNQRQKNYCVYKIAVHFNITLQITRGFKSEEYRLFILFGAHNTSKLCFPPNNVQKNLKMMWVFLLL